jgi:hypothetical protein
MISGDEITVGKFLREEAEKLLAALHFLGALDMGSPNVWRIHPELRSRHLLARACKKEALTHSSGRACRLLQG